MSQENAKAFVEKMNKDGAFRMRVLSERTVEDRMKLIRASGFDCTASEIGLASAEISDDAAAGAAGGQYNGLFTSTGCRFDSTGCRVTGF